MSGQDSISRWIDDLKEGDHVAAQLLWQEYLHKLVVLARKKLSGAPRRAADEEDVALSAFHSFCCGAEQGRFPQLNDRQDLWKLLVVITVRKSIDQLNHENRQKRGGGKVRGESILINDERPFGLGDLPGPEPTPQLAAMVAEQCDHLLVMLDDEDLRSIALWKMEGYTNDEIAVKLNRTRQTVQRKLNLIRNIWEHEVD